MRPFFVVNRPNQLNMLNDLYKKNTQKFGILINTSTISKKFIAPLSKTKIEKICDSGIFETERKSYDVLFSEYEAIKADYGIVIDHYRDMEATIEDAKKALKAYEKGNYSFKLVAVAQGANVDEYIECYETLKECLGFEHIAIGGLLEACGPSRKINDYLLEELVEYFEEYHTHDWIFLLGANAQKRIDLLRHTLCVYGSDSNNWVFKYKKGQDRLEQLAKYVASINHEHHSRQSFIYQKSVDCDFSMWDDDYFLDNTEDLPYRQDVKEEVYDLYENTYDYYTDSDFSIYEDRYSKHRVAMKHAHVLWKNKEQSTFGLCITRAWLELNNYIKAQEEIAGNSSLFSLPTALKAYSQQIKQCESKTIKYKVVESKKATLEIETEKRVLFDVPLSSSKNAYQVAAPLLENEVQENVWCAHVNVQNKVMNWVHVSKGSLSKAICKPRDVFRDAIRENAHAILLFHNHPSGDPTPSQEDVFLTKNIVKAGEVLGIPLLDHIIIGENCYSSFSEMQML